MGSSRTLDPGSEKSAGGVGPWAIDTSTSLVSNDGRSLPEVGNADDGISP